MRYYLISGEASGDLHGSNLIKGLRLKDPQAEFRCWGGDLMQQQGAVLVKHYKESAVMGFVEVLRNIGKIRKNLKQCKEDILEYRPDALILIDYPGFNLRIAEFAKKKGITVFYYIAPKVWAWKESRVHKLRKYADRLFIIFPFEIGYFKKWGIEAIYRGNPLLDSIEDDPSGNEDKEGFCKRTGLDPRQPIVGLLAGSRKMEINFLLPRMLETSRLHPEYQYVLASAPSVEYPLYENILGKYGMHFINMYPSETIQENLPHTTPKIFFLSGETYAVLRHADAAVISSGTASLEAALLKTPQVVCYGGNEISYRIARRLVKLNYISLANLILDKLIFKELIQHDCTPENIARELERLLHESDYREEMIKDYRQVRTVLGGKGASGKIAEAMTSELSLIMRNKNNGK